MAQLVLVAMAMSGLLFLLMLLLLAGERALTRRRTFHAAAAYPAARAAARARAPDDAPPDTTPAPLSAPHAVEPTPAAAAVAESVPRRSEGGPPVLAVAGRRAGLEAAFAALYGAVGLKAPRVAVAPSPLSMLVAYGLAAALVRMHGHAKVQRTLAPGLSPCKAAGRAVWFTGARLGRTDEQRGVRATEEVSGAARQELRELLRWLQQGSARGLRGALALPIHGAAAGVALQAVHGLALPRAGAMTLHDAVAWVAAAVGADSSQLWNVFGASLQDVIGPEDWRTLPHSAFVLSRGLDLPGGVAAQLDGFADRRAPAGHLTEFIAHPGFCIVAARPDAVKVDEAGLLHCADGPSVRWADGWGLYHWHGLRLPHDCEFIITQPQLITVQRIEAQHNLEVRRAMLEIYGLDRFVVDSGALVVNALPPDHDIAGLRGARLFRKQLPGDAEPLVLVELVNSTPEPDGTCRRYMLRVDPQAYGGLAEFLCHAAAASTWRRADGRLAYADFADYRPAAES